MQGVVSTVGQQRKVQKNRANRRFQQADKTSLRSSEKRLSLRYKLCEYAALKKIKFYLEFSLVLCWA